MSCSIARCLYIGAALRRIFLVGLTVWFVGLSSAAGSTLLSEWNLIVKEDVTSSSEVDGSALIGGNLTGTSNYSVQQVTASDGDGLAVGGNIVSGNIQINQGGNLRIGGSIGGIVNLNGGGTTIVDPTVAASVANDFVYLNQLTPIIAALPANGTLDGAGNMNATPVMIGSEMVAIYDVASADFSGLGQLNLNLGTATSVIINVAADGSGFVDFTAPPNMIGGFNQGNSSKILWNLYDATQVAVNNSFNGALIAPDADLQVLGGGINGTVAVRSLSQQGAQVRRFTYTGYLPPVPEPSTFVLAAIASLAGVWRVWRKHRVSA